MDVQLCPQFSNEVKGIQGCREDGVSQIIAINGATYSRTGTDFQRCPPEGKTDHMEVFQMDMIVEPNTFKATYSALQPRTMLDLIETVQNDIELSPTRKRDLLSAIRRFCEVLGLSPVEVPATHAFFRRRLQHLQPKQVGLSRKTFQNIRACVDFALKRYVMRAEFTRRQALTPVWAAL